MDTDDDFPVFEPEDEPLQERKWYYDVSWAILAAPIVVASIFIAILVLFVWR